MLPLHKAAENGIWQSAGILREVIKHTIYNYVSEALYP